MKRIAAAVYVLTLICLGDRAWGWQAPYSVTGSGQLVHSLTGRGSPAAPIGTRPPSPTGSWQVPRHFGLAGGYRNGAPVRPPIRILLPARTHSSSDSTIANIAPWNQRSGSPSVTGSGALNGQAYIPPSAFQAPTTIVPSKSSTHCESCFRYLGASPTGAWYGQWPYCTLAPGGAIWPFFTYNLALAGVQAATQPPATYLVPVAVEVAKTTAAAPSTDDTNSSVERAASFLPTPREFALNGEREFYKGNYLAAVRAWRHAIVDDPTNGELVLQLAQALFAIGKFDESAGAVQQAMQMLPPTKWGEVVEGYRRLYGRVKDYTDQVRTLESARTKSPKSPALHFLLGYHYGFLGFYDRAVVELNKTLEIAPKDEQATKLRDHFEKLQKKADKAK